MVILKATSATDVTEVIRRLSLNPIFSVATTRLRIITCTRVLGTEVLVLLRTAAQMYPGRMLPNLTQFEIVFVGSDMLRLRGTQEMRILRLLKPL